MSEIAINIITYIFTCYIKLKLTMVKLAKLNPRNFYFLYSMRTAPDKILTYCNTNEKS